MTKKEFIKLKDQIDKLLKKAEEDALNDGQNISSVKFISLLKELKRKLLEERGISLEEYETLETLAEQNIEDIDDDAFLKFAENIDKKFDVSKTDTDKKTLEALEKIETIKSALLAKILTEEDVKELIPEPIKPEVNKKDLYRLREDLDNTETLEEIRKELGKKANVKDIPKIPKAKDFSEEIDEKIRGFSNTLLGKEEIKDKKLQEAIIEPVRRLGMGLQQQIDSISSKISGASNVDDETPTGAVNGSNKTFTLVIAPSPATSLKVYINGQRIVLTTDYSLSGNTITMIYAYPTGTAIRCDYRY